VGADGVLKKPFVPPDPLISMVKSALLRAGVPLGNHPAPVEKAPDVVAKKAADLLSPIAKARLEAINAESLPEIEMSPVEPPTEDFGVTAGAAPVRIDAGKEPVAFGSLLDTPDSEDDAAFLPKNGAAAEHAWGKDAEAEEEDVEEEEEEEEDTAHTAWRPGGIDGPDDKAAAEGSKSKDWREEAFHGASPGKHSKSRGWAPSIEEPAHAREAASVGVTTLEPKPVENEVPFSGDAWAAAMAAGVEDKVNETQELTQHVPESLAEAERASAFSSQSVGEPEIANASLPAELSAPVVEVKSAEPANNWFSVSSSPWDTEAKKVSRLAATWDAPATESVVRETTSPEAVENNPATEAVVGESYAETRLVEEGVTSYVNGASDASHGHYATESVLAEAASTHAAALLATEQHETQEAAAETPSHAPIVETQQPVAASAAQPNMDELVARVLEKMSPDVLQRVTRDILRPVIEAIIKDELDGKKS
jgi:hypothetical protein